MILLCVSVCMCLCCVECLCCSQVINKRKIDEQRAMWHINVGTESPASRPGFILVYLTYTRHPAATPNTSFETWQGQKQHGARNIASRIRITRVAGLRMEPAMSSSRQYHVEDTKLSTNKQHSLSFTALPCRVHGITQPASKRFKILWNRPMSVVAGGHDVKFVQTAAKKEKVPVVEYK